MPYLLWLFYDGLIHIVIFSMLILTTICILQYTDESCVCIVVKGRRFNNYFMYRIPTSLARVLIIKPAASFENQYKI
jgi:hypothetical protein